MKNVFFKIHWKNTKQVDAQHILKYENLHNQVRSGAETEKTGKGERTIWFLRECGNRFSNGETSWPFPPLQWEATPHLKNNTRVKSSVLNLITKPSWSPGKVSIVLWQKGHFWAPQCWCRGKNELWKRKELQLINSYTQNKAHKPVGGVFV